MSENDLELLVMDTDNKILRKRGLQITGRKKNQVELGNYGRADILTFKRPVYNPRIGKHVGHLKIQIIELKKDIIDYPAFDQALRYFKGVSTGLKRRYFFTKNHNLAFNAKYEIILVGKQLKYNSSLVFASDIFKQLKIYTFNYYVDGLEFDEHTESILMDEGLIEY